LLINSMLLLINLQQIPGENSLDASTNVLQQGMMKPC
jgi:hypothetical protein